MDTRGNHITSTAATLTGLALLCMLGSGVNAALFSWDGNGDGNNGGNWSDPLLDDSSPCVAAPASRSLFKTSARL